MPVRVSQAQRKWNYFYGHFFFLSGQILSARKTLLPPWVLKCVTATVKCMLRWDGTSRTEIIWSDLRLYSIGTLQRKTVRLIQHQPKAQKHHPRPETEEKKKRELMLVSFLSSGLTQLVFLLDSIIGPLSLHIMWKTQSALKQRGPERRRRAGAHPSSCSSSVSLHAAHLGLNID